MDKCIHDKGYCEILSDNEVKQPCIEGPCVDEMKLKPCPFCGGEAEIWQGEHEKEHTIRCKCCAVKMPIQFNRAEAIEAWNRRATCTKVTE